MLSYEQLVWEADKDKKVMWESVSDVSCLIEHLWRTQPQVARKFMFRQFELMKAPHYDGLLSREEVSKMMHIGPDGQKVVGELVTVDEASSRIPSEKRQLLMWDAYVAYNGFMHDLAHSGLGKSEILKAADSFWFHDDDFPTEDGKVWNYYKNL